MRLAIDGDAGAWMYVQCHIHKRIWKSEGDEGKLHSGSIESTVMEQDVC